MNSYKFFIKNFFVMGSLLKKLKYEPEDLQLVYIVLGTLPTSFDLSGVLFFL